MTSDQCALAPRLVDKKNLRRYDDCLSYTLVGSKKALKQAGLDKDVSLPALKHGFAATCFAMLLCSLLSRHLSAF